MKLVNEKLGIVIEGSRKSLSIVLDISITSLSQLELGKIKSTSGYQLCNESIADKSQLDRIESILMDLQEAYMVKNSQDCHPLPSIQSENTEVAIDVSPSESEGQEKPSKRQWSKPALVKPYFKPKKSKKTKVSPVVAPVEPIVVDTVAESESIQFSYKSKLNKFKQGIPVISMNLMKMSYETAMQKLKGKESIETILKTTRASLDSINQGIDSDRGDLQMTIFIDRNTLEICGETVCL